MKIVIYLSEAEFVIHFGANISSVVTIVIFVCCILGVGMFVSAANIDVLEKVTKIMQVVKM